MIPSNLKKPIDNRIIDGLNQLIASDDYLLKLDVNERSITHKLAEHYQKFFPDWNVDCEYNKNLSGPKTITINPQEIIRSMVRFLENTNSIDSKLFSILKKREKISGKDISSLKRQLKNKKRLLYNEGNPDRAEFILRLPNGKKEIKTIYPDIIVHHRGAIDNLIVIEAKKSSNKDKKSRIFDTIKLITLVISPEYRYKQGVFIDLPTGIDFQRFNQFEVGQNYFEKIYEVKGV